jgi:Ca-activated chloride channel family protein
MNEARFHHLESLHWLWLVLAIFALLMLGWSAKRRAMMRFAAQSLWYSVLPNVNWSRQYVRGVLILAAAIMLVAALLDPRWGVRYEEVQRRGIDILFVVDVSRSMLAEDVKPNRLERAKQYISDVVDELGGDRVGLVSFAGIAALKCPLTIDYGAFRLSLNELNTESAARGGSQLGDALRLAHDSFTDEARDARIVIVLSDGEDQGSYPEEAAQKLVGETGAHIFTVGLGDSNEGARIPIANRTGRTYLTYQGQEVWSKLNSDLLTKIALAGGGAYVPAGTASFDLGQFYQEKIAPMGTRTVESGRIEIRDPQYQWFAGLALAFLLADSWMSNRKPSKTRWPAAATEDAEGSP